MDAIEPLCLRTSEIEQRSHNNKYNTKKTYPNAYLGSNSELTITNRSSKIEDFYC
jgi:hypothetical protein